MSCTRLIFVVCLLLLPGCGGPQRTMHITSEPEGALVWMNNQEIGRTPLRRDFIWYGNYDLQIRREGYETLKTSTPVTAPWWQWPPFDLFVELLPVRLRDERRIRYTLEPASTQPVEPEAILVRAEEMRNQLRSSPRTRQSAPTTVPTTRPR